MVRIQKVLHPTCLLILGLMLADSTQGQPIMEFPVGGFPRQIIAGPDGKMWFSKFASTSIGTITMSGEVTADPISASPSLAIQDFTFDLQGDLWFAEDIKIGHLPKNGLLVEFSLPQGSRAFRIAAGPEGSLWFTEPTNMRIGRITQIGSITEFAVFAVPEAITAGPDGNMWFTEAGGIIGRITPAGEITEFLVGTDRNPYTASEAITAGPDGALWFTGPGGKIGRITTNGLYSEYGIPRFQGQELGGITSGPDGNLWFTEGASPAGPHLPLFSSKIGRITPVGIITEFLLPDPFSHPLGIASGPDGNLWVAEFYRSKIARIRPTLTPCDRCLRPVPFRQ